MKIAPRPVCRLIVILLICSAISGEALTQDANPREVSRMTKRLPKPESRDASPLPSRTLRAPPPGPVHCVAEWEESEGVMTNWENWDLVDKLQQDNQVYIPVDNNSQKNWWINYLTTNGVPLTNVRFLFIDTDTVWTRDYGPWFVWDADNDMGIIDYIAHPQSTYGPDDNAFPYNFAQMFGINYYDMGIYHVGGNWFPAGYGQAFSTTRIYTQNPYDPKTYINQLHEDYLGIEHYNTTHVAPWTIEHHDCWGKPVSPDTFIIVQYEETSSYYEYAETMYDYISSLESPWGRPYEIHRLPMFKMGSGWYEYKPYMNSLVSNKSAYVPVTNSPDDAIALAVWQDALPGHKIVGVDHMGMGFNDALHCRTRNFVKRDALRIYAIPPGDTEDTASGYTVTAEVIPPKGSLMSPGYPKIFWTDTGGAPFNEVVMGSAGGDDYIGDIPAKPLGTEVSFYIEARDDGGHAAVYPIVAPDGMMTFEVRQDAEPPIISRYSPTRSAFAGNWPCGLRLLCKDDMVNPEVSVEYAINGIPQPDITLVREDNCYWYGGNFGGTTSAGDVVTYRVLATDNAGTPNVAVFPLIGEAHCPVRDEGGVGVVELSPRPYSTPFILKTLDELGVSYSYYTSWPADWNRHDVWLLSMGVFWDRYQLSVQEANDLVAALQAGNNIYLESSDAWYFDPNCGIYIASFGVYAISDGGDIYGDVKGISGSIADGLYLDYRGESAWMDEIGAVSPAKMLFRTASNNKGRAVQYDAGTYKTIASAFPLGGLVDGTWPETKKELLIRYLEYLGSDDIQMYALAEAESGRIVTVRMEGKPGDGYIMFASLAEDYMEIKGYGEFRLDLKYLLILGQGVIPGSGVVEFHLPIPHGSEYEGLEVHLQAATGAQFKPNQASFTNRDILTIRN